MPPEEVQGVLGRAFSNFARDIDTAKTHLSRLAEGSVIVGAVRGMRPEDQAALATSFVPGVGDAAGLYADYTDIRENWDQVPWYDKAGMVGAAALGAVPFVPSRSQVNAGAEVAREKTIAYHGSPHDFPPVRELQMPDGARVYQSMGDAIPEGAKMLKEHPLGRFNMSKIGTGEGAQAYGYGLYFAEAEDVARGYRDQLTSHTLKDVQGPHAAAVESFKNAGYSVDDAKSGLRSAYPDLSAEELDAALRTNYGGMYQVEIDASPDEFLDWDLPLSEQSDLVRKNLLKQPSDLKGKHLYYQSAPKATNPAEASNALSGLGIKGIRYKDEFSRGKEGGTSNYVVFDENLISIARKYGIAIPAAAAMLARQTGQNPQDMYEDDST